MTTIRSYKVPPTDSNLMTKTSLMIQYKKEIGTTERELMVLRVYRILKNILFKTIKAVVETRAAV